MFYNEKKNILYILIRMHEIVIFIIRKKNFYLQTLIRLPQSLPTQHALRGAHEHMLLL